jgi:hypothetical protein
MKKPEREGTSRLRIGRQGAGQAGGRQLRTSEDLRVCSLGRGWELMGVEWPVAGVGLHRVWHQLDPAGGPARSFRPQHSCPDASN